MGDQEDSAVINSNAHKNNTLSQYNEPMPQFLAEPTKIGEEISVTGKWIPAKKGGLFRKSAESKEMLKEWEDIHAGAKADAGVLSTEINHAVGEDAVLVHHVFKNPEALIHYFSTTATQHMKALTQVAKPERPLQPRLASGESIVRRHHCTVEIGSSVKKQSSNSMYDSVESCLCFQNYVRYCIKVFSNNPCTLGIQSHI